MGVQFSLWDPTSSVLGCTLRSRIAGSCHNSFFFFFWGSFVLFSIVDVAFYIPPYSTQEFQFLHTFARICYIMFVCLFDWFDSSHFVGYDVMSHVALICISLIINNVNIFSYAFWPYFFGDMPSQVICRFFFICQFFNQVFYYWWVVRIPRIFIC